MSDNDLLNDKYSFDHNDEDELLEFLPERPEHKYGFIAIKNPDYLKDKQAQGLLGNTYCDEREYLFRKPTVKERREIVINTVIEGNGRPISIPKLARLLAISDRTLQTLLKKLQEEKIIEVIPRYAKNGARKCSSYKYIGPPCEFYGTGLNLHILYSPENDVGFRHWAWKSQFFSHDKTWHDLYKLCKIKFDARVKRGEYLRQNNLPLAVPEDIKFFVLRYAYWKGCIETLCNKSLGEVRYSKDGTVKLAIEPLNRTETVPFFDYTLQLEFGGSKYNPEIKITDVADKEVLGVFTWFTENVIERSFGIDERMAEQFFILGDFTTK